MKIMISRSQWELIGKKTGWIRNAQDKVEGNQPLVDMGGKRKSLSPSVKSKINKMIHALGNFHKEIPLDQIFTICGQNGVVVIQEDGTKWSGFLMGNGECGSDKAVNQRADFDLAVKLEDGTYVPANNMLHMTWCVMGSGKYEVVAYIS